MHVNKLNSPNRSNANVTWSIEREKTATTATEADIHGIIILNHTQICDSKKRMTEKKRTNPQYLFSTKFGIRRSAASPTSLIRALVHASSLVDDHHTTKRHCGDMPSQQHSTMTIQRDTKRKHYILAHYIPHTLDPVARSVVEILSVLMLCTICSYDDERLNFSI